MNSFDDRSAMDVIGVLLELEPDERASRLESLCGTDPHLCGRVVQLLKQLTTDLQTTPGFLLDAKAEPSAGSDDAWHGTARSLSRVGRFQIIRSIGAGAMGEVYEAQQDKPSRRVALKVIRPEHVSRRMLRRFEYEAEWLGRLDHPGIARVYDAGAADTPDGPVPYVAMELIDGMPLDQWLEKTVPALADRVKLLISIADAVQHAHGKGLIHRDLKPANILITKSGEPKVLDFGVARALGDETGGPASSSTLQTMDGALIGTVQYMSPEQSCGDIRQLDTRSDIYALGVIAFQVLAGRLPYVTSELPLPDALTSIRTIHPPRMGIFNRRLRGDLETIVAKAMEKEKARRYDSAAALAEDFRRVLKQEPILARPPSLRYQLGKLARRHKVIVGASIAVTAALVLGVIGTSVGLVRAERARLAEVEQRKSAETAKATTDEVNRFLNEMLSEIDPAVAQGKEPTIRDVFDGAAGKLDGRFPNQPLVEAEMHTTFGTTYVYLGLYEPAIKQLRQAFDLRRKALGDLHPETLAAMRNLANALGEAGRTDEADPMTKDALEKTLKAQGPDHRDTLRATLDLGSLYFRRGKLDLAEALLRDVVDRAQRVCGPDDELTLTAVSNLAVVLNELGRPQQAEPFVRQTAEARVRLAGPDDPDALRFRMNLASSLHELNRDAESLAILEDVLERRRRVLGPQHPSTLQTMNGIGRVLQELGRVDEAEAMYRQSLLFQKQSIGEDHINTLTVAGNLATLLAESDRLTEADEIAEDVVRRARKALGGDHPDTLCWIGNLGSIKSNLGLHDEAIALLKEAADGQQKQLGDRHPATLFARTCLAMTLRKAGRPADAKRLLEQLSGSGDLDNASVETRSLFKAVMALSNCDLNQPNEAELRAAVEKLVATEPMYRSTRSALYQALSDLCEKAGRIREAREWRAHTTVDVAPGTR